MRRHRSHAAFKAAASMQVDWCACCGVHLHLVDKHGNVFACAVPDDIGAVVQEIAKAREERRRSAS